MIYHTNMEKIKSGSYIYKGYLVPINAQIITDNNGKECRLYAIDLSGVVLIYLKDNKQVKVSHEKYNEILAKLKTDKRWEK